MKKITFTLNIEVLETLEKKDSEGDYVKALYELLEAMKHGEDLESIYFDTALEVLDYIEELNADLGYFSDISKLGVDLFE